MIDTQQAIQTRLLAIIAFVFLGFALRQTYAVTMPFAAAAVVIAAVWPVKPWLERYLPATLSILGTVCLLFAILAAFTGMIWFSVARVAQAFTDNSDKLQQIYQSLSDWARSWGVSFGNASTFSRLISTGEQALASAYNIILYIGVIAILVVFGLPEVDTLRQKIDRHVDQRQLHELVESTALIADRVRRYLWVTTLTSGITGLATFIVSLMAGLDLALVWALLNFLLNYIPIVDNFMGIVPPTLYAVIQFDGWVMPAVVFVAFSTVQIIISNFVAPTLQGRSLALTPMAVILALSVWSWIWGVAGALIAVPLTSAAVVLCNHFPSVKWIATLLEDEKSRGRSCERQLSS